MRLVEEQAEVCEDYPQLLPSIAVFEFPQQVPRQLILQDKSARKGPGLGHPWSGGKDNSVSRPVRPTSRAVLLGSRLPGGGGLKKTAFRSGRGTV